MQTELQVVFRGMDVSDAIEAACREEAARLEGLHDRITSCRVVVEAAHRRHRKGDLYEVKIDLNLPGAELVVSRTPPERQPDDDVMLAVAEAFDAMRRRLEDHVEKHKRLVKRHEEPPHGRVAKLFDDHGFIETPDGDEVYFHANAVLNGAFDRLAPGTEVRFVEQDGDKGPQASSVRPVGRHHHLS